MCECRFTTLFVRYLYSTLIYTDNSEKVTITLILYLNIHLLQISLDCILCLCMSLKINHLFFSAILFYCLTILFRSFLASRIITLEIYMKTTMKKNLIKISWSHQPILYFNYRQVVAGFKTNSNMVYSVINYCDMLWLCFLRISSPNISNYPLIV